MLYQDNAQTYKAIFSCTNFVAIWKKYIYQFYVDWRVSTETVIVL
jgi:hypothetical protein